MPKIDYLNEDQPINGQKYALISIIGPHTNQKSDVWAIKIKGTAPSEDAADAMGKRLQQLDPDVDIHRVPVGVFFPLAIDPTIADNVVYQDEQLNEIVRKNKENRLDARDHFEQRKRDMMEDAIREGKDQNTTQEHPIAVLNDINKSESRIQELAKELEHLKSNLNVSKLKFDTFSIEDKKSAANEYNRINQTQESVAGPSNSLPTIQEESNLLYDVKEIELINEKINKGKLSKSELDTLTTRLDVLHEKLKNKESVNNLINANFNKNTYGIF